MTVLIALSAYFNTAKLLYRLLHVYIDLILYFKYRERELLKMANNNISIASSMPTFIPSIVMIATWQTQTPYITSTSATVQTDTQTCHTNSAQTSQQTSWATQTVPSQSSTAIQTELKTTDISTIDSTDSSTPTEVSNEMVESTTLTNWNRKRKIDNKDHGSNKQREYSTR